MVLRLKNGIEAEKDSSKTREGRDKKENNFDSGYPPPKKRIGGIQLE